MKSKLIILAIVAVTLLSFTVVSVKKSHAVTSNSTSEQSQKGFALQDNDQF